MVRDAKPERGAEIGDSGGSCTERRGVVISMTGGVEGAEREKKKKKGAFFLFFIFYNHVFVVKVQETAWSASYSVNKTINNPTTCFTPLSEKSNPSKPEPIPPPVAPKTKARRSNTFLQTPKERQV